MDLPDPLITISPDYLSGEPVFTGTRVMVQSLFALRHADGGFDEHGVLTMQISVPAARYDTAARRMAFFDAAQQRLRALPGVENVGTIDNLPFEGGSVQPIVLEGQVERLPKDQPTVQVRQMMNLSSSFDHRVVDGAVAAAYIQRVRELLEHPATLFID